MSRQKQVPSEEYLLVVYKAEDLQSVVVDVGGGQYLEENVKSCYELSSTAVVFIERRRPHKQT